MSEVIDFGQSYAEARQVLSVLAQYIDRESVELIAFSRVFEQGTSIHEETFDSIVSESKAINEALSIMDEAVKTARDIVDEEADRIEILYENSISEFDSCTEQLTAESSQYWDLVNEGRNEYMAANEGFIQALEKFEQFLQGIEEYRASLASEIKSLVDDMTSFCQQLEAIASDMSSTFMETSKELLVTLEGDVVEPIKSSVLELSKKLSGSVVSIIDNAFQLVESDVDGMLEEVKKNVREFADKLIDQFSSLIRGMETYFTDQAVSELEIFSTKLVTQVSERLLEEAIESLSMAQLGSSITAAMSPILPQLVVAKEAVELLEKAKSIRDSISDVGDIFGF